MIADSKILVYVAHPYGGQKENLEKINGVMKELVLKDEDAVYLSPLNNFGMLYFIDDYSKGLGICLSMLEQCDVLVLCGDWQNSKGCMGEWAYAQARGKDIFTYEEWKERIKKGQ